MVNKLKKLREKQEKVSKSANEKRIAKTQKQRESAAKKIKTSTSNKKAKNTVKKALIQTAALELGFKLDNSLHFDVPAFPDEPKTVKKRSDLIIREDIEIIQPKFLQQSVPFEQEKEEEKVVVPKISQSFFVKHDEKIKKEGNPHGLFFLSPCLNKQQESDQMSVDTSSAAKKLRTDTTNERWKMSALKQYGWGDKWANDAIVCHCAKCELKHVASNSKECKLFVLVDLDNWGLGMMSNNILPKSLSWLKTGAQAIYLWCFYGAGFRDFLDENGRSLFDRAVGDDWHEIQNSVFGLFKKTNHIRFSLSGHHKQSSDLAILNVVKLLRERVHLAVISKDKKLLESAKKLHASVGGLFFDIDPDEGKPFEKIGELYKKM